MKKKMYFLLLLAFVGLYTPAKAILVNIPDANFRAKLQTLYPACFVSGQMETTCVGVTSATSLFVNSLNIANLSGIEYFTSLTRLDCSSNLLVTLPLLPAGLTNLNCSSNKFVTLPPLPMGLTNLNCSFNLLVTLPPLPVSLTNLNCSITVLETLPLLPMGLQTLNCSRANLVSLPTLPTTLQTLICNQNKLTSLPTLPSGLSTLICYENELDFADLELINPKPLTYDAKIQDYSMSVTSTSTTITFNGSIGGSLNVYKWYRMDLDGLGPRMLIPSATSATYTETGSFSTARTYTCEVTSTYVGVGTTTNVLIRSNSYIPSPTTSIDNSLSNLVKVSPNPSNGDFSIDFGSLNLGKSVVRVYDAQGKTVFSSNMKNNNNNNNVIIISLINAPNGIYLLQISTEKGNILKRIQKAD